MDSFPQFETKRLLLRDVREGDIPSYQEHFADYEVIRNLSHVVPWPYPKDGVKQFLDSEVYPKQGFDSWLWGIFLKNNPGEIIGAIGLWRKGRPEHRGFWLGRKFWNQGIMTEAVVPVMNYAFNELCFEKLIFANAVGNIASRRIKEKTGATFIGVEPAKFVDPTISEHELWELGKKQWEHFLKEKSKS